MGDCHRRGRVI
jgi:hypothetical protein